MPITLGQNISALSAQRRFGENSSKLSNTFERLSSGQRINKASDDAAGLALSSALNSRSRVFAQAMRNVSDGISFTNIADGALNELSQIATRIKELSVQASNSSLSRTQRLTLNEEADELVGEFNRIVQSTSFNGIKPYDGSPADYNIQAGYGTSGNILVELGEQLARNVGDGTFTATATLNYATEASVITGDFNGDGKLDLLRVDAASTNYGVHLGNGDGTFQAITTYDSVIAAYDSNYGDFNNDGKIDVIFTGSTDSIAVALSNGNGTFQAVQTYQLSDVLQASIQVSDLNGDGYSDIYAVTPVSLDILFANSDGTLQAPVTRVVGATASDLRLFDADDDSVSDLVVYHGVTGEIVTYSGNGDGTFGAAITSTIGTSGTILVGDYNRDGLKDIAVTEVFGSGFSISLSNGDGTFSTNHTYSTTIYPLAGATDINSDGILDLMGTDGSGAIGVFYGNGDGTFREPVSQSFSNPMADLVFGGSSKGVDINGDGVDDAFLVNSTTGEFTVLITNTDQRSTIQLFSIASQDDAEETLNTIGSILDRVAKERGMVGAAQSRLDVAFNTLGAIRENYIIAESRITDADIAQETADLVRLQILQQATTAVMAQANQAPALALELLAGSATEY